MRAESGAGRSGPVAGPVVLLAVLPVVLLVVLLGLVAAPAARAGPGGPPLPLVPAGAFSWPLAGVDPTGPAAPGEPGLVTQRFRAPPTPYGRGHRGVDLAAAPGTPVLAAGAGTVVFAGVLAGRGVVSVAHADGLRTTYEPVAAGVAAGTAVARGAPLGVLVAGHRGCPPACLHWGLRHAVGPPEAGREQYLDPLLLLGLGRVRLLPWSDEPS